MDNNKQIELDILKRIEELSIKVNDFMSVKTRSVFRRYPLTFIFLILIGVIAVSEGMKDIITHISFFAGHPWRLLVSGLIILIITGSLYKKLDK